MIYIFPLFDNFSVRFFQGIENQDFNFQNPETVLHIDPLGGKSSFINALLFLFYGDMRILDNRYAVNIVPYNRSLALIYNSESKSIDDLKLENDYLSVTGTYDLSFLERDDLNIVDDYVVKVIFKREIDIDKIKQFGAKNCSTDIRSISDDNSSKIIDYAYLCYDENKYTFNTKFKDIFKLFTDTDITKSMKNPMLYRTLQTNISDIFGYETYFNSELNITVGKNGKVHVVPPSTIQYYILAITYILSSLDLTIVIDDVFSKLDYQTFVKIINSFRKATMNSEGMKKFIFISNSNESYSKFKELKTIEIIKLNDKKEEYV